MLSRYLNQILECEGDLNLLCESSSSVQPRWLYTLLSSAIGPKMQVSTRKFLGDWIMRSGFLPDLSNDYVFFLHQSFLPWAIQGTLFTASLRRINGEMRCQHGDKLATYLQHVLSGTVRTPTEAPLIDALLSSLVGVRAASFAYARVYLLEGLGRAVESLPNLMLSTPRLEKLMEISNAPSLPEVARDYVLARSWKICADSSLRSGDVLESKDVVSAVRSWHQLQAKGDDDRSSKWSSGPIASWESKLSPRDVMQNATLGKMQALRTALAHSHSASVSVSAAEIEVQLQDIWSDLEYMEYPKEVLMEMPGFLMNKDLVLNALEDETLCPVIVTFVRQLLELSEHRQYMLAPIACAIREAMVHLPDVARVLPIAELILNFAQKLPRPTVDLQLEDAASGLLQAVAPELLRFDYEYYFGDRATVGVAALLDLVSRLGQMSPEALKTIFDQLLQLWFTQKMPPPTICHWKSSLQLQILLLCCEQLLTSTTDVSNVRDVLEKLHHVLSIEPIPCYRYLLEWTISRLYQQHQHTIAHFETLLNTRDHHANPKYLASLMKIGIALAEVVSSSDSFATRLASAFVPLAASSKIVIRHEAQWQVPVLMNLARSRGWSSITESTMYVALDDYIRSLARFGEPPQERQLDKLDLVNHQTLTHLVEGPWFGLDDIESPLCCRADFLRLYERDCADDLALPASCMPLGDLLVPSDAIMQANSDDQILPRQLTKSPPAPKREQTALQTKGTAHLSALLEGTKLRRSSIIVVASLVDNPYNLGGMSRVSEVFGAAELHLQNQNVTSNKDFQAVAVSSHLHFPICQLSAVAVPLYLTERRREGWTVVGVEQTDRSVVLGSEGCRLPEKIVLVMGSEKEGIPALVLAECDLLVEIAQQGVTRSLNVQTAAAIVLYEYSRQHQQS